MLIFSGLGLPICEWQWFRFNGGGIFSRITVYKGGYHCYETQCPWLSTGSNIGYESFKFNKRIGCLYFSESSVFAMECKLQYFSMINFLRFFKYVPQINHMIKPEPAHLLCLSSILKTQTSVGGDGGETNLAFIQLWECLKLPIPANWMQRYSYQILQWNPGQTECLNKKEVC